MRGSIHSDERCPVCGSHYRLGPKGLACPNHPKERPHSYVVRYGRITKRFHDYLTAAQFLGGLRFEDGCGQLDVRDYQAKLAPLAFDKMAQEWLEIKRQGLKPKSWVNLRLAMDRASAAWGGANIKNIQYAQVEDLMKSLGKLAPKSRQHTLAALKQFWQWAEDRYDVPNLKKWPRLGYIEMAYRQIVDLVTQEAILDDIKEHEPFLLWLCIKWLANYIGIRPGEMVTLTDGHVDRLRATITIPHPKEKRAKTIPLAGDDIEIVRAIPVTFDRETPFFRHQATLGKAVAGHAFSTQYLYKAWKRACKRLGIEGVDLYGGTRHSTAHGLREVLSPEQIQAQTMHSTSKAFRRYFDTGGEDLRKLLATRQSIIKADNSLIMEKRVANGNQIIEFPRN